MPTVVCSYRIAIIDGPDVSSSQNELVIKYASFHLGSEGHIRIRQYVIIQDDVINFIVPQLLLVLYYCRPENCRA
jgi:hypothetical protein